MKNWLKRYEETFGDLPDKWLRVLFNKKQLIKQCIREEKRSSLVSCPICGNKVYESSWHDDAGAVETNIECKDHWEESWAYGHTYSIAKVGNFGGEADFSHNAEDQEALAEILKYENGIKLARKEYQKRMKTTRKRGGIK